MIKEWITTHRNPVMLGLEHADRVLTAAGKLPQMVTKLETQLDQMNAQAGIGLGWKVAIGLVLVAGAYAIF